MYKGVDLLDRVPNLINVDTGLYLVGNTIVSTVIEGEVLKQQQEVLVPDTYRRWSRYLLTF